MRKTSLIITIMLGIAGMAGFMAPPTRSHAAEVPIADCATLRSAVFSASSGDHLVLANQTFECGEIIVSTNGLVIRGASLLGPTFRSRLTIRGNNVVVFGLNFEGSSSERDVGIEISGNNIQILRNRFNGWSSTAALMFYGNGRDAEIAYNEFSSPVWRPENYQPHSSGNAGPNTMGIRTRGSDSFYFEGHVHHNHFHDFPAKPKCNGPSADDYYCGQNDAIEIGNDPHESRLQARWLIEKNIIERHLQGSGVVDIKSGYITVRQNTLRDGGNKGRIDLRHSTNSVLAGNVFDGVEGSYILGSNHEILGNVYRGNSRVMINTGNGYSTYDDLNPAADNTKVIGNTGRLVVGDGCGAGCPLPARNTCIEGHITSTQITYRNHTGSTLSCSSPTYTGSTDASEAPDSTSEVGPNGAGAPGLGDIDPGVGGDDDDDVIGDDDDDIVGGGGDAGTCNRIKADDPVPAGFGSAWAVWGNPSKSLMSGQCDTTGVKVQAGNGGLLTIVHKTGYAWDGTRWTPFTFAGQAIAQGPSWLSNSGESPRISFTSSGILYAVGYVCEATAQSNQWNCGCRSQGQCSSNSGTYWNLQKFDRSAIVAGDDDDDVIGDDDDDIVGGDDDDDTVILNCSGTIKTLPSSSDSVGQCYSSPKIAYTDNAKGRQGYRLTTWGKTLHRNITLGHTGSQETTQWSPDSTKITFTMAFTGIFGKTNAGVFVYDLETERITLLAKDVLNRGSAFNKANANEVVYWKIVSGGLQLTAVNTQTLTQRSIIMINGADDAGVASQSNDSAGRYFHAWMGQSSAKEHIQSVVIDTQGTPHIHPEFPFDPNISFTLTGGGHDLYQDTAIWNPVRTSVAFLLKREPLSNLGPGGVKELIYDFSTGTGISGQHAPAHSSWTANGDYLITNFGVYDRNMTCIDADHNCNAGPNDNAVYGVTGLAYGRLESSERGKGLDQRFVNHPYNGRLQEVTVRTAANVPWREWTRDPQYTIGYSFGTEAGPLTKLADIRRQYSPNGKWLLWRSNLRNRALQAPPGPDDGQVPTTDIFILDAD